MVMTMERETRDQAIVRLAGEAARRGVRVFRAGSEWFCPSSSQPGTLHRLSGYSCDCRGFMRHGRCTHHAALLSHMGWLPTVTGDPDPPAAPVAVAPCSSCDGQGVKRMSTGGHLDDWVMITCRSCRAQRVAA